MKRWHDGQLVDVVPQARTTDAEIKAGVEKLLLSMPPRPQCFCTPTSMCAACWTAVQRHLDYRKSKKCEW